MNTTETSAGIEATLQHIGLISARRVTLEARQTEAEDQLVHRIATAYRAGNISLPELAELYRRFREVGMAGCGRRWNAVMPVSTAQLPSVLKSLPNGHDGSWDGEGRPAGSAACPPRGVSVVYVLYDEAWRPVYVGSTGQFRDRIKRHASEKRFTYWRAWPCRDRLHAYQREAEMLDEVMPHLNRRRESHRTQGATA